MRVRPLRLTPRHPPCPHPLGQANGDAQRNAQPERGNSEDLGAERVMHVARTAGKTPTFPLSGVQKKVLGRGSCPEVFLCSGWECQNHSASPNLRSCSVMRLVLQLADRMAAKCNLLQR